MNAGAPWLRSSQNGACLLSIWVQPGAKRSGVVGLHGDALKVAVRAKAVDGEANRAVCKLLAGLLGVAPSDLMIVRGQRSRSKQVLVSDMTESVVADRLTPIPPV